VVEKVPKARFDQIGLVSYAQVVGFEEVYLFKASVWYVVFEQIVELS